MPSFAESLGLGALTSWLSGSSKAKTDTVGSSAEPEKHAKPSKVRTITISSNMLEGKTFEEAMAAISSSLTDSEETDELADELEAATLSENAIPDSGTGSHSQTECENAGGTPIKNAALQNSSNLEPGCQCCGGAFQTEYAVTKVMKAAGSLGLGSTEYFDAIAHVYHYAPSQVARRNFLKTLVNNLKEQNWLDFDSKKEGGFKVMDYAAGTGILSHALAPHVTEILAIDMSSEMVEQYNKIVAKENNTKCEMKAVHGDMTSHFLSGKKVGIEQPDGVSAGFDVIAMCLAVDFFTREDVDGDMKHEQLVKSLEVMIHLIETNGTLLIIDVDKCDEDCYDEHCPGSPHEGLKVTGHGSKDIVKALEELGMEDIAVIRDQHFLFEAKQSSGPDSLTFRRKETYFVLKAKRGPLLETRLSRT